MAFKFRSKAERTVADWLTKNKIKWKYESTKIPYTSVVPSGLCLTCGDGGRCVQRRNYTPDFFLVDHGIYIEVKGRLDSPTRKKLRDIRKDNPDLDLRLLLLADNKITKNKPERYSDWCHKNKFTYAIKNIPTEWLNAKKKDS